MGKYIIVAMVFLMPGITFAKASKPLDEYKKCAKQENLEAFYKRAFNRKYPQDKLNKIFLGLDAETVDDVRGYYLGLQVEKTNKKQQITDAKDDKEVESILGDMKHN